MRRRNVIIMGAAGRDFHNFNVCFRHDTTYRVSAFTAAQIPFITNRRYPPELAGPLYPRGITIHDEAELEVLINKYRIDQVVFAYSDISHQDVMHLAARVLAMGPEFRLIGPDATMLKSRLPVISVCAVRTGCGKSQTVRYICDILLAAGVKPVVVRHPMPYGDLAAQAVERFTSLDDLAIYHCTIEEREEYEPLLKQGLTVYAGVDYGRILKLVEREADVIIWDGGNNDFSFFRPDLEITVADPLRVGDETAYFPGEVNLRRAKVVVINKVNAAEESEVKALEQRIAAVNSDALVIRATSEISATDSLNIAGKSVLVIEDGPTVTHGNLPSGAGLAAALKFGASKVVDPRPYAVGSLAEVFRRYPNIGPVLPAVGYRPEQIEELRRTVVAVPCDLVLSATPIDIALLLMLEKPVVRVFYDLSESGGKPLAELIARFAGTVARRQGTVL